MRSQSCSLSDTHASTLSQEIFSGPNSRLISSFKNYSTTIHPRSEVMRSCIQVYLVDRAPHLHLNGYELTYSRANFGWQSTKMHLDSTCIISITYRPPCAGTTATTKLSLLFLRLHLLGCSEDLRRAACALTMAWRPALRVSLRLF